MGKTSRENFAGGVRHFAAYTDLGLRFAAAAALGGLGGYWLDGRLHTTPIFLIAGVLLGGVAGFINLYRTTMRLTREEKRQARRQNNDE